MPHYTFGFYRTTHPLSDIVERTALAALDSLNLGFFPATFLAGRGKSVPLTTAADYHRSLIPRVYFIDRRQNLAHIPFDTLSDLTFTFTELSCVGGLPASLMIEFTSSTLLTNRWAFDDLLRIFRTCVAAVDADYAYGFEQRHRARDDYREAQVLIDSSQTPIGLFWFNYFGPAFVQNVGITSLNTIAAEVPVFLRTPEGGLFIAIQETPYDETDRSHSARQRTLEQAAGINESWKRFRRRP